MQFASLFQSLVHTTFIDRIQSWRDLTPSLRLSFLVPRYLLYHQLKLYLNFQTSNTKVQQVHCWEGRKAKLKQIIQASPNLRLGRQEMWRVASWCSAYYLVDKLRNKPSHSWRNLQDLRFGGQRGRHRLMVLVRSMVSHSLKGWTIRGNYEWVYQGKVLETLTPALSVSGGAGVSIVHGPIVTVYLRVAIFLSGWSTAL